MNLSVLLFFDIGAGELFLVFLVILMLFGAKKIPEFARGLGKGIRYVKNTTDAIQRDIQDNVNDIKRDMEHNGQLKEQTPKVNQKEEEDKKLDKQLEEQKVKDQQEKLSFQAPPMSVQRGKVSDQDETSEPKDNVNPEAKNFDTQ